MQVNVLEFYYWKKGINVFKSIRKELDIIALVLLFLSLFIVNKSIFHLIIIPIFILTTIFNIYERSLDFKYGSMNFILMLIGISLFPSMFNSTKYHKDIIAISYLIFGICIFLQIRISEYKDDKIKNAIIGSLVLFGVYNASITLFTFYSNYVVFGSNYAMGHNLFGNIHQNSYAVLLNMILPCLTGVLLDRSRIIEKTGILLIYIMFSGCIILTLSKIAFLMLLCNVIFLVYYGFNMSFKKLFIVIIILLVCAVILMPDMLKDRFVHLVKGKYYLDRLRIWSHGLIIAMQNPFAGSGYSAYNSKCCSFRSKRLYAGFPPMGSYEHSHNFFIHWFLSYGIFSLGLVVLFGIKIIRNGRTNKILLMLILLFLISSVVDYNFFWYKNTIVFACLCGIYVNKNKIEKKQRYLIKTVFSIFLLITLVFTFSISWDDYNLSVNKTRYIAKGISFHYKYFDLRGIEKFKKGLFKDAEKAFRKALRFSSHNHKLYLKLALSLAAQDKPFAEQINIARKLNVPDEDGSIELTSAVIYDYAGLEDQSVKCYRNYIIKFPDFILNPFFSYRTELKHKILKLLERDSLDSQKHMNPFYLIRLSEIFYYIGDFDLSKKLFKKINFKKSISRPAADELDYADILRFRKEYIIMKIRLISFTPAEIDMENKFQRDEIINELIKKMFHAGKWEKAIDYSQRLCNERNYLVENYFLNSRLPDGLFFGILSALKLKRKKDAENFIDQLFYEQNSLFIAYLAQSFFELQYGSFQKAKDNFSKFIAELSRKTNPFYTNIICSLVLNTDRMKKNISERLGWNYYGLKALNIFYSKLAKQLTTGRK